MKKTWSCRRQQRPELEPWRGTGLKGWGQQRSELRPVLGSRQGGLAIFLGRWHWGGGGAGALGSREGEQ